MKQIDEIISGQSIELLKELHLLTRDGKLNQDARRKLKQIYHLYHFIEPLLKDLETKKNSYYVIDHGAGKSYLGFILYDLFLKNSQNGKIIGIETRKELVSKSIDLSRRLNFTRMNFFNLNIEEAITSPDLPSNAEMVTALHACDTATDDAITFGLKKKSKYIILIPCCQAEVASNLKKNKHKHLSQSVLTEIYRHPIHTREFGCQLTNVLRCLRLESKGYQVTVTELTGLEHSLKNELIIAHFKDLPRSYPEQRLKSLLKEFHLEDLEHRFL